MGDKNINQLPEVTAMGVTDLFVLEQAGAAKKLTGQLLKASLMTWLDGHGGVKSFAYDEDTGKVTVTATDGTSLTTGDLRGAKGDPGVSPTVSVTRIEVTGGRSYTQVTFTDADGGHTATIFDGEAGEKGASGTHGNDVTVTGTAAEATTEHRNGGTKLVFTMTQYNASGAPPTTLELPFTVWNGNDAEVSGIAVSLPASGWDAEAKTQTVSVTGMTESALVITSAAPVSFVAWSDAGVRCAAQSGGALTFACETVPAEDLTGNVVILA